MEPDGLLRGMKYLIHNANPKFTTYFRKMRDDAGVQPKRLPPISPNFNAYAERWIQNIKVECLSKLIITSERGLLRVLREYLMHFREERNHQGRGYKLLFPRHHNTECPLPPSCEGAGNLIVQSPTVITLAGLSQLIASTACWAAFFHASPCISERTQAATIVSPAGVLASASGTVVASKM